MPFIGNALVKFEDYEIDRARWQLSWKNEPVPLTRKTFDLLVYLVEHADRVVGKDELLQTLWPGSFVEESNLSQHIFLLRKALSRHESGAKIIETVPGRGYRFAAAVTTDPPPVPNRMVLSAAESITRITFEENEEDGDVPALTSESGMTLSRLSGQSSKHRVVWITAGVVALATLGIAGWFGWQRFGDQSAGAPIQVVLSPLAGTTGDAVLDESLTQVLRIDLAQSPYVSVVPTGKVQAVLTQMMHKPTDVMTPAIAREVCERTNSQTVLSGNIAKVGGHFLLTEEASNCVNGSVIASAKYEATGPEDLPRGIDKLAATLRRDLGESRSSIARFNTPLFSDSTPSLEALKAFTQGTQKIREGKFPEAISLLKTALAADPQFASAEYNLAAAYGSAGDDRHQREAIAKAYSLRATAARPAQLAIVAMYEDDFTGDIYELLRDYETWVALYPNSSQAWSGLANTQRYLSGDAETLASSERTSQLLPHSQGMLANLALDQRRNRDLQGARATCERAIADNLDGDGIRVRYLEIAYELHDAALIQAQIAWGRAHPEASALLTVVDQIAIAEGRFTEAHKLTADIRDLYRRQGTAGPDDERAKFAAVELMQAGDTAGGKKIFQETPIDPEDGQEVLGLVYAGDIPAAQAALHASQVKYPKATMVKLFWTPITNAAIAMAKHKPADAAADLEAARPLDHVSLVVPWLRGRANLAAGQPIQAEKEFRSVIDHPEYDPASFAIPLSWLGLGEALAAEGNRPAAVEAYQHFLTLWSHADPDATYLRQAKQEFAALQTVSLAK